MTDAQTVLGRRKQPRDSQGVRPVRSNGISMSFPGRLMSEDANGVGEGGVAGKTGGRPCLTPNLGAGGRHTCPKRRVRPLLTT